MKKDTRANLIFITLFLLLALPGIWKLTSRAYRTGGRDPAMRLAVRGEWAYMDPTPQVRDLPRVVPPGIGQFVRRHADRIAKMQAGLQMDASTEHAAPIMSKALTLQLLGAGPADGNFNVALLAWNSKYAPLPTLFTIVGKRGSEEVRGSFAGYEPLNLPVELRMELQDYGYVVPPDSLMWMIVTFPGDESIDSMDVHFKLDQTTIDDELTLPNSGPTTMPTTMP